MSKFALSTKQKTIDKDYKHKRTLISKFINEIAMFVFLSDQIFYGEFDPGSGRTLAACLTHASRAMKFIREWISGERVRNT